MDMPHRMMDTSRRMMEAEMSTFSGRKRFLGKPYGEAGWSWVECLRAWQESGLYLDL